MPISIYQRIDYLTLFSRKALKEFELTSTQISDAGLAHLKGLTALRSLNLRGTQISDAGLSYARTFIKYVNK